jgi:hypothetical protein
VATSELKVLKERLDRTRDTPGEDIYHTLTLDPSSKDHRLIALFIDYTSKIGECPFYLTGVKKGRCTIAPDFTIMWNDCEGKCFVGGVTCLIIADHESETEESSCMGNRSR